MILVVCQIRNCYGETRQTRNDENNSKNAISTWVILFSIRKYSY